MSALAVGVSLIGFGAVLFTLSILIQMLLSFPAMLSSNARVYVRNNKTPPTPPLYHNSFVVEVVDEDTDDDDDGVEEDVSEVERRPLSSATRLRPMTRGRTLRRESRRRIFKRVEEHGDEYDSELNEAAISTRKDRNVRHRNDFVLSWKKSMEWSRR